MTLASPSQCASPPQYVVRRAYQDFDDLVCDMRQWDLDLRQIDRGPFRGEVLQFGIGDVHVAEGRFGRVLEQTGAPPATLRTIAIPANQQVNFLWRGRQVGGTDILVFPRGGELASVSSPDFHVYTCSFPEDLLASLSAELQIGELDQLRGSNEVIRCRPDVITSLQNQLHTLCASVGRDGRELAEHQIRSQLRFELPRQLLRAVMASDGSCVSATSRKRDRAVALAQAFIERYAREAITAKDVCRAAGVSQRTLEYAFDERYGVPPKAFLLAYRLNLVRRELRSAVPATAKIVEIANEFEFWHMGRFAADYRRHFQELPSETLRHRGTAQGAR